MKKRPIPILFEDEAVLVCEKPAGLPVQADRSRTPDLLTELKIAIYERDHLTREPYLAVVHRLDRPVGGLLVLAKTREAAAALTEQIKNRSIEKNYQAVVCGYPEEECGTFTDYLLRDAQNHTARVVPSDTPGAKKAVLDYELIDAIETQKGVLSLVMITLHTGRHHQIRVQFASRNLGLYGDTKYNPLFQKLRKKYIPLGLYATRIVFQHPVTGERLCFKTEPRGEAFEKMEVEAY